MSLKVTLTIEETQPKMRAVEDPKFPDNEIYVKDENEGTETERQKITYELPRDIAAVEAYLKLVDSTEREEIGTSFSSDYHYRLCSITVTENGKTEKVKREQLEKLIR
jgi:hypothetical protein